jgi:hypothetical protein
MLSDVQLFAASVRQLATEHAGEDLWRPGAHVDDRSEQLTAGLVRLGWLDLAAGGDDALPFVSAAALELGRAGTTVYDVVQLLGGSPVVDGLAMYARPGDQVIVPQGSGYAAATVEEATPVAFADSLGVHLVTRWGQPDAAVTTSASRSYEAAVVGYYAGLTGFVVSTAISHARDRQVFGRTLAHLDAVQQRLADAATVADALALSAREGACGLAAVAHAAASAGSVMLHGHMVFGALGFTLEFPLQRYSRRSKALSAFVNGWLSQQLEQAA